jgi:hypothetical protein
MSEAGGEEVLESKRKKREPARAGFLCFCGVAVLKKDV